MKIKAFSGKKTCKWGESYIFRKGVAVVPGCFYRNKPLLISIREFNTLNKKPGDNHD